MVNIYYLPTYTLHGLYGSPDSSLKKVNPRKSSDFQNPSERLSSDISWYGQGIAIDVVWTTPWKINMSPKDQWLEHVYISY